jgi:hypothetical protein
LKPIVLASIVLLSQLFFGQASITGSPGLMEAERQSEKADREIDMRPGRQDVIRTNVMEMRRDATELAALAQSVPQEVDMTTKGMLPKELAARLKRIEKLAKSLRNQLVGPH